MSIIVKPNTFTGSSAPQLPWLDADIDVLYSEVNGQLDNDNLKTNAGIAQSKISNLVTDLAARLLLAGGQMIGAPWLRFSAPYLRLQGLEASAKDWRLTENAGLVTLDENTGTEAIPIWTVRYQFRTPNTPTADADVSTKKYVDDVATAAVAALAYQRVAKAGDELRNATTLLTNDVHLKFAMAASKSYRFVLWLLVTGANTTADMKIGWALPAGATMFWGPDLEHINSSNIQPIWNPPTSTTFAAQVLLTEASVFTTSTIAGTFGIKLSGIVRNSTTPGDFQLQWAQNTSNAVDLFVLKDSLLEMTLIQ
jgi:hypothetical protein